ncbi:MAG: hypothetical protein IPM79_25375 [Polyangiaceae bacterium]|nr:hypothetical protein [Polyangiaceae bacterium]
MAYNSRTEINVCYDVTGDARVRVARHPHVPTKQAWGPWSALTSETNYHLHEAVDGDQVEWIEEAARRSLQQTRGARARRYVSLFCMFDPAPTGVSATGPASTATTSPSPT